jgi:hypothetical protein
MLGAPFKPSFWLEWANGSRCATPRLPRPPKGTKIADGLGSVHPPVTAAEVSAVLPFVIPSAAEASAVLFIINEGLP